MASENDATVENNDVVKVLLDRREKLINEMASIDDQVNGITKEYNTKMEEYLCERKPIAEALEHLDALLKLEGYDVGNKMGESNLSEISSTTTVKTINDAAFEILEKVHKPIHYRELASMLQRNSIYIPGKDIAATLLSRMSRDSRFKRTKQRGVYALATWRVREAQRKRRKKGTRK